MKNLLEYSHSNRAARYDYLSGKVLSGVIVLENNNRASEGSDFVGCSSLHIYAGSMFLYCAQEEITLSSQVHVSFALEFADLTSDYYPYLRIKH